RGLRASTGVAPDGRLRAVVAIAAGDQDRAVRDQCRGGEEADPLASAGGQSELPELRVVELGQLRRAAGHQDRAVREGHPCDLVAPETKRRRGLEGPAG